MTISTVQARPARCETSPVGGPHSKGRRKQAEDVRDADDALAPFIGLANGVLASLVVWGFLGGCAVAAYHFAPSWVATAVNVVLLADGAR